MSRLQAIDPAIATGDSKVLLVGAQGALEKLKVDLARAMAA